MPSAIVKHVAEAIYDNMNVTEPPDLTLATVYAEAAIDAMRNAVKCTKNGCQTDDIFLNQIIDEALKGERDARRGNPPATVERVAQEIWSVRRRLQILEDGAKQLVGVGDFNDRIDGQSWASKVK